MNGIVFLAVAVSGILGPVLFASLIADLTRRQIILLTTAACLVVGYFVAENSEIFDRLYWQWTVPAAPPAETAFIAAAENLHARRVAYADGKTSLPEVHRAETAICALPTAAVNWVGRITQKYLSDTGRSESLSVAIHPHVIVRTALFPDESHTLIPVDSHVFAGISHLESGDVVRFDGRIVGHAGACPGDPPIDNADKLRDPEFLFAFSQVSPATGR